MVPTVTLLQVIGLENGADQIVQPGLILKGREYWTECGTPNTLKLLLWAQVMHGRAFWSPTTILVWYIATNTSVLQGNATPR